MPTQVYFVGAGPGDPDLITVKGRDVIRRADLVLYAGSLVPREIVAQARKDARVEDSAPMTLEQTHALLMECVRAGGTAARVHTGDPALYGAVREQLRLLRAEGVECETVPGVTAAFAAAAAAQASFTVPERTQTLIVTRLAGRTPVPEAESLRALAAHGCALAVYLSAGDPEGVQAELLAGGLPPETPVVAAHRLGWPGQRVARTSVGALAATVRAQGMDRQAVFLVLPGEAPGETGEDAALSRLYAADFSHGFRK
jgi:precorrin-4/cobalt-precorrin-4 C11-methyltransferase